MAITNTRVFPKHLDGDINKIFFDEYDMYPSLFDKIARIQNIGVGSGGKWTEAELSGVGRLQAIKEGNPYPADQPKEGNEMTVKPTKYGLMLHITEEMVKDDRQQNFKKMPATLGRSAAYEREVQFWDLFNNGFATHKAWDGNYIFVKTTRKTLKSLDNQYNRPTTDAALSETPLQAAFEYFDGLKGASGIPVAPSMRRVVIVPKELRWTVKALWASEGPYQSADRNINTLKPENMEEDWRPLVNIHLTSSTAWFVLDLDLHDFRFQWYDPIRMSSADDFNTDSALFKVSERFGVGCFNPIGGYGTTGA